MHEPPRVERRVGERDHGDQAEAAVRDRRPDPTGGRSPRTRAVPGIQFKLDVGATDDRAEREADTVAASVVQLLRRGADRASSGDQTRPASNTRIRRRTDGRADPAIGPDGGQVDAELEGKIRSRTGGAPLDRDTREKLEGAFGVGFSDVRIHRDSEIAPQLGATAFTLGHDIHFAAGRYDPGSESGQLLLSHELTHVVQQSGGRIARRLGGSQPTPAPEREEEPDVGPTIDTETKAPTAPTINRSSPLLLRRKVGFEFETGVQVGTKDWIGDDFTGLGYQDLVFTATSRQWKVVADSSNMEFVTEPFNENAAGRALLVTAMGEIANWAGLLPGVVNAAAAAGHPSQGRVDAVNPAAGTTSTGDLFKPILIVMDALADADIIAAPQATGGVRLDQIPALIDQMVNTTITAVQPAAVGARLEALEGWTDGEVDAAAARGEITAAQADDVKRQNALVRGYHGQTGVGPRQFASSLVAMNINDASTLAEAKTRSVAAVNAYAAGLPPPAPNLDKLKGLLTIVVSYMLVGHRTPNVMPYSKIVAPLMARTNFYGMYRLLSGPEQTAFTEGLVLNAANLPGTGAANMFTAGFNHEGAIDHGPTRSAWVDSIIRGTPGVFGIRKSTDLMSQGSGSTAAANSTSLGSMERPDTRVTGQRDLAVLELRRLPKRVHRLEWSQMALDIFDVITHLP